MAFEGHEKASLLVNRLDASELFSLLESQESLLLEDVKSLVHENLHASREPFFLYALVEYYMETKSTRCLDILTGIRQPHDKHLFDKTLDSLKNQKTREQALYFLSDIVRKQPSWLHRIASHKVLPYLLSLLKTDMNIPNLNSGVLTIVTLLPIIPSLAGPHLNDIFEVFARLAAWNTKKTGNVPESYFLHLAVSLHHLFSRLYAMYPCNFLAFLRHYYGGRENSRESKENLYVFHETILPMLERVRLHPLLVVASKESELGVARWKNMEPHDIIVQCSKVSLDTVESLPETDENYHDQNSSRKHRTLTEPVNILLPTEPGSLLADVHEHLAHGAATPLQIADFSPTDDIQQLHEEANQESSLVTSMASKAGSEIDMEVVDMKQDEADGLVMSTTKVSTGLTKTESSSQLSRSSEGDVVTAEEAKEENQRSESHPMQDSLHPEQPQSHFVSTTDTLTATMTCSECEDQSGTTAVNQSLTSSTQEEEQGGISSLGGASNVLLERLVHGINRLRFFSHCGHPPDIPIDWLRRSPTLRKSYSWPVLKGDNLSVSPREMTHPVGSPVSSSTMCNKTSDNAETKGREQSWSPIPKAETPKASTPVPPSPTVVVIEAAKDSQPSVPGPAEQPHQTSKTPFTYLAPGELLDRYLQLGSQVYMQGLSLTCSKDTNWTHFGGPAPADEITILRGEITLLHTQLLFERYRREVHAERNRRLLGKAKKARALEEQNNAMRDQLVLQEKEINELNNKLFQLKSKKEAPVNSNYYRDLEDHVRLLNQDNKQLDVERKKLEATVKEQQKEIAEFRKILDETQGKLMSYSLELEAVRKEASRCPQLEQQVRMLTNRLTILHELHERYQEKAEQQVRTDNLEFQIHDLRQSATHDIEELKRQNRLLNCELEAYKHRVQTLEQATASKDLIIEEQKQLLENVKSCHSDILLAKRSHIQSLQKICQRQEEHILELSHKLCIQDSLAKPVPQSSTMTERPWHPAQSEPTSGIVVVLPETEVSHSGHQGTETKHTT